MGPTRKPFWESSEEIDIAMFAEALVSVFRFLPEVDALALFSSCLEPERSESVKTCAVRACLTLIQEVSTLDSRLRTGLTESQGTSRLLAGTVGKFGSSLGSSIPQYI